MDSILHRLPRSVLEGLARALAAGRVRSPYNELALGEWVSGPEGERLGIELERLAGTGFSPQQIGVMLNLLAAEREIQQERADGLQLVWTGPDQEGPSARDTSVIVRELLATATRSLLITTFSISRGPSIFEPVRFAAERNPGLCVTIVLNIDLSRRESPLFGQAAVNQFASEFWRYQWPWADRPSVFYDPRGVAELLSVRANQHAKCVVADSRRVFITSANYTEWAQERNIELGVVIDDERLAQRVVQKFDGLIASGLLCPLPSES